MKTPTYHSHKCVLGREAEAAEPHRQSRGGVAAGQRLLVSIDNSGISTVATALIPVAALFF
jgi:hypothetical protein